MCWLAGAVQAGAVETALSCLDASPIVVASAALALLQSLLISETGKDAFMQASGAKQLDQLLKTQTGSQLGYVAYRHCQKA